MRYLILLATATAISSLQAAPIDTKVNQLIADFQAEVTKNDSLRKEVAALATHVQDLQQKVAQQEQQEAKSKNKIKKLKTEVNQLETAAHLIAAIMPELIQVADGATITLSQRAFTRLVSLIPLQSISPNIELNGATYTIDLRTLLTALMQQINSVLPAE